HFRRQRAIVTGPTHIPLDAFTEGFLGDADLEGAETRIAADLRSDDLIDGGTAGAVARERGAGGDTADGFVMAIAGARGCGHRIVDAGDYVDVIAKARERREAGGHDVI